MRELGRHIAGKPLCLYYDSEYREDDADFEPAFPTLRAARQVGAILKYAGDQQAMTSSYAYYM